MSRTFRRVKHAYDFYGYNRKSTWLLQFHDYRQNYNSVMQDCIKYFSDRYKANSRMLNTTARQMMRAESRVKINRELTRYIKSADWGNYSIASYMRYSDPWCYD